MLKKQCSYTFAMIAQLVEHDLAKVGVASSSLVHRSMKMQDPVLHLFSKKSNPIRETSTRNQRSVSKSKRRKCEPHNLDGVEILLGEPLPTKAQVAELVDAYVSGAYAARCAGSSPVLGTDDLTNIKSPVLGRAVARRKFI